MIEVILADPPKKPFLEDPRADAAKALGTMRSRRALPAMLRQADKIKSFFINSMGPLQGYPCGRALFSFGPEATVAIAEYLKTTPTDEVSDEAIRIFAYVGLGSRSEMKRRIELVRIVTKPMADIKNIQRWRKKAEEIAHPIRAARRPGTTTH